MYPQLTNGMKAYGLNIERDNQPAATVTLRSLSMDFFDGECSKNCFPINFILYELLKVLQMAFGTNPYPVLRWGKSLNMDMLRSFLSIEIDE